MPRILPLLFLLLLPHHLHAAEPAPEAKLFARENLVAWCIVPFDAKHRKPAERAEMLKKLGFTKFAYDWRAEHIPSFDEEIAQLKTQGIELTAWWFPAALNDDAKQILAALERGKVKTQLWITMGDPAPGKDQAAKVKAAADQLRPIAEAAARQGCSIGLYNHGGWFGEPENQIAIIEELKLSNVGIVYNQHHGHDHLDRFEKLLPKMKPHLYALNLNGMDRDGERRGRKILPLGQGELDLPLLTIIAKSGYTGPIGILGHTQDDAEARLQDNLDGLDWLVPQLHSKAVKKPPVPRTPVPAGAKKADDKAAHAHDHAPAEAAPAIAYDPALVKDLIAAAKEHGDARRGLEVFAAAKFACVSCHKLGVQGGSVGPDLTAIGKTLKPEELAEAILWPKKQVKPEYIAWTIITSDGRSRQGYKRKEDAKSLELFDIALQQAVAINKADIEDAKEVGTLMPENLASSMTATERRDLLRLLTDLGHTAGLAEKLAHVHSHEVASFTYKRDPLHPEHWPAWQEKVNRDRLYDFYTKEALHFAKQHQRPALLPAYPGLDGGKLGHWGNQNEDVWRDDRWNQTDLGTLQCGVFHGPSGSIPKGVCVRLGEKGELSVCFNPETLCYEALWKGGFLKFSAVRHGFMDGLRPAGEMLPRPEGKKPEKEFKYLGFFRRGPQVVFYYNIDGKDYLDLPMVKDGKFEHSVTAVDAKTMVREFADPQAQWPQEIVVRGTLGRNNPYATDTIPLPASNPWNANIFPGDHAFTNDGTLYLCTMQGEVWQAKGIDDKLEKVSWRRFASGLHQALGMVVRDNIIYVLGRDQITRLADANGDGEADFYQCVSNAMLTSPSGHDYTCGLEMDDQGRFYTSSGKQGLIRISNDGKLVEVLATGFRNPDGLGLCPDGAITVPCSEGEWTPASMICLVKPSETAGQRGSRGLTSPAQEAPPHFGYGGPRNNQPPALPLVYLPRGLDNSSGGQIAVPDDDRWGPLAKRMIHFSFGAGSHFLLLRDEVAGQAQGAIVPLVGEFRSGAHRGKFNPKDGQLYVSGMAGWGSYTPDDGCLHRVRYTGGPVQLPIGFHVHENGILVKFAQPLDAKLAADAHRHFAQAWNYRYSQGYGSPELSPRHPGAVGHDPIEITSAHVVDTNSLFLEMPDIQPVNVLHLALAIESGDPQELFITVNKLDKPYTKLPNYRPAPKTIAAHPLLVDLASLKATEKNPFKTKLEGARTIEVSADKNLTFAPRTLTAKPGEPLRLTFHNPDVVPHNWVLIKSGTLPKIGDLTNKLVADPEAVLRHYVPKSDDVLAYTDIVSPSQSFTIFLTAPKEPGRYPFLCTFPGHWMVMNGELVVK